MTYYLYSFNSIVETKLRVEMKKTIMIVEDNELNMKLFDDLLQAKGYDTIKSTDGRNILETVNEYRPDLIIMDIQLPLQSGVELTLMLKANGDLQHIPVIAVTAFAMDGDEEMVLKAGCDGYITKPISVPDFLQTIAKHVL